jgi:signal transduction histidine kinase/ActR/RegA family two-component response regulator
MPDLSEPTSPPASGIDWRRLFEQRTAEGARRLVPGDPVALAAWEAARAVLEQSEERLAGRTAELEVLQALGRRCAEATRPGQLFATAAQLLHERAGFELFAVALAGDRPRLRAWTARPCALASSKAVAAGAWEAMDSGLSPPPLEVRTLDGFDPEAAEARSFPAPVVVLLPRRGRTIAALAATREDPVGEAELRLVYGAANQLVLHLDRILVARESEQGRFRTILDSLPQAVVVTDATLRVVLANAAGSRLLAGLPAGAGPLPPLGDLDLAPLVRGLPGAPEGCTAEARLADGRLLALNLAPAFDAHVVLVATDVTEERRIQERLAQSEKLSSLGQMISGIAHELNNPLASVLGFTQLLARQAGEGKQAARLDLIHQEARRCQRIVQNLLSFARQHEPERRQVSCNEVVHSVVALLQYQMNVDGVRLVTELDPALPAVLGDPHQLQQVLVNLLTNATHAIQDAGMGGRVRVRTEPTSAGGVRLTVEDDGPGVPEALRSRIFDPFFTTKPAGRGTGLGLSLVYGIVAAHAGTIELEAPAGAGATFRIELPPAREDEAHAPEGAADEGTAEAPGRILVVDDEDALAHLVCEALLADGHHAEAAASGLEALARLRAGEYDLVVSDVKMPDMGAQHLHREMERLRPGSSRRLILTSGDTVGRDTEAFARRAELDLLHKPFDLDDLRRLVRTRLARSRGH